MDKPIIIEKPHTPPKSSQVLLVDVRGKALIVKQPSQIGFRKP